MTQPGFHPTFTITHAITAALTLIERARGFLEAAALCSGVNRRTLQRDLKAMLDLGLMVAEGATNRLEYRIKAASE